jgi:hypothetical protein
VVVNTNVVTAMPKRICKSSVWNGIMFRIGQKMTDEVIEIQDKIIENRKGAY